jgi:hypothetical protein
MTSTPLAARRLAPLLGAALALAAVGLSACGGDGAASTVATAAKTATAQPGGGCPPQIDVLLEALDTTRRQLAVGLSYEQYAAAVERLRKRYARVPVDRLSLGCLASSGTPAEGALNSYIDGVNAWGECLADATCATATIEPVLQRRWRRASRFLSEAQ